MRPFEIDATTPAVGAATSSHRHIGRWPVTRRAFLGGAAGTAGALVAANAAGPLGVAAKTRDDDRDDDTPRPIPGGIQPGGAGTPVFHVFLPGPGFEPATITDFHGLVGVAALQGTGTGRTNGGAATPLLFDVDVRFMKGTYVGVDGEAHKGTFGFI